MSRARVAEKLGFNATWSMSVGGMVGGGIFTVLGVVVTLAGEWTWLSFALGGIIALCTGHSYVVLSLRFKRAGGAFEFLREARLNEFAGGLSWVLLVGYALTLSVYGFTFGHYLQAVLGVDGAWLPRVAGVAVIVALVAVNLRGVSDAAWLEVVTVWGKLVVLLGLAGVGLARFDVSKLTYGAASPGGVAGGLIGAAAVFMAYEGFQLLTYDYDDIRDVERVLPLATMTSIAAVIVIYIMVAVGATSIVGADQIVAQREVALAAAGQAALGTLGMVLVSVAAVFSSGSAINATLFAAARLARRIAEEDDLPSALAHRNADGIPDRGIVLIGLTGALLAGVGSLGNLVQAASLAFLFTFVTVNGVAAFEKTPRRWVAWIGLALGNTALIGLMIRMLAIDPAAVVGIGGLVAFAGVGRLVWHLRRRGGATR